MWTDVLMALSLLIFFALGMAMGWQTSRSLQGLEEMVSENNREPETETVDPETVPWGRH
jgi:hypothetical protein